MARNNQHSNIINFFETAGLELATAILGIASAKVRDRVAAATAKEESKAAPKKRAKVTRRPRAPKAPAALAASASDASHALSGAEQMPLASEQDAVELERASV